MPSVHRSMGPFFRGGRVLDEVSTIGGECFDPGSRRPPPLAVREC
jgi:hypothetical protein